MRVLFVLSIGHLSGGACSVWLNLMDGLRAFGVEPYAFMPTNKDDSLLNALDERGIVHETAFFSWWTTADESPRSLRHRLRRAGGKRLSAQAEKRIAEMIRTYGIDVVFICDGTITAGLEAAAACGVPAVWHFHEVIGAFEGAQRYLDSSAQVAAKLAQADALIAVSDYIASNLAMLAPQASVKRIYNGIDASNETFQELFSQETATFTLCGRIDNNKGQAEAIEAFSKVHEAFPNTRLLLVGEGERELTARLKEQAARSSAATAIEFCGQVEDTAGMWAQTDVALNCSFNEGCSMVLVEALHAGRLVIASDAPGNVELVADGRGLSYERRNTADLARTMCEALEHQQQAKCTAAAGKCWARENLTLRKQLEAVYAVFEGVVR